MIIKLSAQDPLFLAVKLAQERKLLPTELSTAELQELTVRMKERLFFSARTSNLWYVEQLKKLVERYVQGEGRDNDLAQLRVEARKLLAQAGYTPESGFPGDAALGIPPASADSLRDLSSEKRLNLIFETQAQMMRGLGMKLRGLTRLEAFPAWELIRLKNARKAEWQRDWGKRWEIAGDNTDWQGALKDQFFALQTSPIWQALGSSALFPDALNTDAPPFAFNSGMGWRAVGFRESEALGLTTAPDAAIAGGADSQVGRMFAQALGGQTADPALAKTMRGLLKGMDAPTMSAADADKLRRFKLLRAKFEERAARNAA